MRHCRILPLDGYPALPYNKHMSKPLLTIVETNAYLADAKGLLTDEERAVIAETIATDPERGDVIVGGGGIRKIRFAVGGRGKSGGARVVYLYHSMGFPAFLLTVFGKNERADLTRAEVNALAVAVKRIIATYGG